MTLDSLRAAALLTVALIAACGDAPTDPAALLVAEQARAALDVSVPLPSLTDAVAMDPAEFQRVLGDLGVWLDAAEARLEQEGGARPGLTTLRSEVAQGRGALMEAARLEDQGERAAAVARLIGAEAHLLRTTAFAVAERRIAAASAAEARCDRNADGDIAVRRGRRLLAHAREALAEEDFEIALQRAHYAEALLRDGCRALFRGNGVDR